MVAEFQCSIINVAIILSAYSSFKDGLLAVMVVLHLKHTKLFQNI